MTAGILALLQIALFVWALLSIIKSTAKPIEKILWVVIIIALPLIGFIIWYLLGPKGQI